MLLYVATINRKSGHDFEKKKDGVWESSEGERGMGAMNNNIIISKCKINNLN